MPPAGPARLNFPRLIDNRTGEEFFLTKDNNLIGRHRSCDLIIPVVEVSRRHCRIFLDEGLYYVEDLQTVNGTYVNEKKLKQAHLLQEGFHLKVAKCSKYPVGVKNYIFRLPKSMLASSRAASSELDRETKSLRKDLLSELQDDNDETIAAKPAKVIEKIDLRHAIVKVARVVKRKAEALHQVPVIRFGDGEIGFYSLYELEEEEPMLVVFNHPTWPEPIELPAKVRRVGKVKDRKVHQIDVGFDQPEAAKARLEQRIIIGQLIKYFA